MKFLTKPYQLVKKIKGLIRDTTFQVKNMPTKLGVKGIIIYEVGERGVQLVSLGLWKFQKI